MIKNFVFTFFSGIGRVRLFIINILLMIGGTLLSLLFCELVLQVLSLGLSFLSNWSMPIPTNYEGGVVKIMCIGESTTKLGYADSYPRVLERMLKEKFQGRGFVVINEGMPGTSSDEILKDLPEKIEKYKPNIIITMIGINDRWKINKKLAIPGFLKTTNFKILKLFGHLWINHQYAQLDRALDGPDQNKITSPLSPADSGNWPKSIELKGLTGQKFTIKSQWTYHNGFKDGELYFSKESYPQNVDTSKEISSLNFRGKYGIELFNSQLYELSIFELKKGLKENPNQLPVIEKLILAHIELGDIASVEKTLKSIPLDGDKLIHLASVIKNYMEEPSHKIFKLIKGMTLRGLQLSPKNPRGYEIASGFESNSKRRQSLLDKSIFFGIKNSGIFFNRYDYYLEEGKFETADKFIRPILDGSFKNKNVTEIKRYLEGLMASGNLDAAKYNFKVLKDILSLKEFRNYSIVNGKLEDITNRNALNLEDMPETVINYNKIIKLIIGKKITPIVMQYPRLEVEQLKKFIHQLPSRHFVSNIDNFEKTLKYTKFEKIFYDNFAGRFGHSTKLGSELIAENIINTLSNLPAFNH